MPEDPDEKKLDEAKKAAEQQGGASTSGTQSCGGAEEKCPKCGKAKYPQGGQKPTTVKRVFEPGKPKYQLRSGEEGPSTFDGGISDGEILANFREGSQVESKSVAEIEGKGLTVVHTHGDCDHLKDDKRQDNHWEIRRGPNMTRNQFKTALKTL